MNNNPISENILGQNQGSSWVWLLKRNVSIAPLTPGIHLYGLGFFFLVHWFHVLFSWGHPDSPLFLC
jgi:hypothetical protein